MIPALVTVLEALKRLQGRRRASFLGCTKPNPAGPGAAPALHAASSRVRRGTEVGQSCQDTDNRRRWDQGSRMCVGIGYNLHVELSNCGLRTHAHVHHSYRVVYQLVNHSIFPYANQSINRASCVSINQSTRSVGRPCSPVALPCSI